MKIFIALCRTNLVGFLTTFLHLLHRIRTTFVSHYHPWLAPLTKGKNSIIKPLLLYSLIDCRCFISAHG